MLSWRPLTLLLITMIAVGCSEPFAVPPDGNPCATGSEAVYGWPFDDAHRCVDFAATDRRVVMGCLPIENRVMGGAITCYARTDGSQRVMTPWYYYSALESQGWTACAKGEAAALQPYCR
jgi:hypothetical protein